MSATTRPALKAARLPTPGTLVRVSPQERDMMLAPLAETTGVKKGDLSRQRRGQKNPPIATISPLRPSPYPADVQNLGRPSARADPAA
jgi:hypothetical protein